MWHCKGKKKSLHSIPDTPSLLLECERECAVFILHSYSKISLILNAFKAYKVDDMGDIVSADTATAITSSSTVPSSLF